MTTPTTTKGVERDGLCESCDGTHRKDGGGCFGFFFLTFGHALFLVTFPDLSAFGWDLGRGSQRSSPGLF